MGTGNNGVGKASLIPTGPDRAAATGAVDANVASVTALARKRCQGAMSQQGFGSHGNECYPQKLVQLVGHRDPQPQQPWDRLRLKPGVVQSAE